MYRPPHQGSRDHQRRWDLYHEKLSDPWSEPCLDLPCAFHPVSSTQLFSLKRNWIKQTMHKYSFYVWLLPHPLIICIYFPVNVDKYLLILFHLQQLFFLCVITTIPINYLYLFTCKHGQISVPFTTKKENQEQLQLQQTNRQIIIATLFYLPSMVQNRLNPTVPDNANI
jgi:hypothetical protein